jgi:hypothetical protein
MVNERFIKRLWISFGVVIVGIVIASAALYFFAGNLSATADTIVSARTALTDQNAAVANLASLKQQAAQAAQYEPAISHLVPNQYGLVPFSQWFTQQGTAHNVTADAMLQGTVTPSVGSTPGSAAFSFTATGSLSDIASFLDFVSAKTSEFLVTLSSFNVTTNGTNYSIAGNGMVFSQ